jgi:HTH-type transcriptional regulator / antitoxin HigA
VTVRLASHAVYPERIGQSLVGPLLVPLAEEPRRVGALIQLSLRYRTDDHLWFTFFHEIGHVLRHGKSDVWIETTSTDAEDPREAEAEADKFPRGILIPPSDARELPGLKTIDDVRRFAERLGIASGIVVGRLQHDQYWPHSHGNQLKAQLTFTAAGDGSQPVIS